MSPSLRFGLTLRQALRVAFIFPLALAVAGCGERTDQASTEAGASSNQGGQQNFNVTGHIEGNLRGTLSARSSYGNIELRFNSIRDSDSHDASFEFQGQPEVGEYTITNKSIAPPGKVTLRLGFGYLRVDGAQYRYILNEDYTPRQLIIEESTPSLLRGRIALQADLDPDENTRRVIGQVTLEGSFEVPLEPVED